VLISDLTEGQRDLVIATSCLPLRKYQVDSLWTQCQVMVGFAAAGFCACGALWTIGSPPDHVPTVFGLIPWLYAFAFGLAGVALFLFSLVKLRQHPDMMRATERAYLISLFEELEKKTFFFRQRRSPISLDPYPTGCRPR